MTISLGGDAFNFFNHQFILGYRFVPRWIDRVTTLYAAFLLNAAARRHDFLNHRRANLAAYGGFNIGQLLKKGDWSFDTNVQYAQPQAVPGFDFAGIGVGNSDNIGLYSISSSDSGPITTRETSVGRANYIGWEVEFLYLITDNLTLSQSFKISHSLNFLPTRFNYKQYRLEFIYAW